MVFPPRGPRRQLRRLRRCSPRPRTRCTGSTTTRLVTSADISSASLQRPIRRIASRSSVVRLRVVSLPVQSSLAARVSASLERPSPVDSGRRSSLSSIVFTPSVGPTWLHTFACVIQRRTDTTLARHHVHWRSHIPV